MGPSRRRSNRFHQRGARRRETVWTLLAGSVLTSGVVVVVLLTLATQRQAVTIARAKRQVAGLVTHSQALRTHLLDDADPQVLHSRARRLHMHPATHVRWGSHRVGPLSGS